MPGDASHVDEGEPSLEALGGSEVREIPPYGPLPVSVPGAVDGWCALHERFGKLPLADVLAPSIAYARAGAPIWSSSPRWPRISCSAKAATTA